jgi:hypothetical protein
VTDDRRGIADLLHLGEDVGAEQHGDPSGTEVADGLADLANASRVKAVGGLVEDQQLRSLEQGGRDREPLLHAERVGLVPVLVTSAEGHGLERLVDAGVRLADRAGQQQEVLSSGEHRGELRRLHHRAYPRHHLGQVPRHLGPEELHRAPGGTSETEQHPDRGGLAGAVGAEEPVHAARGDGEVEVTHRHPHGPLTRAEGLVESVRLDHEIAHRAPELRAGAFATASTDPDRRRPRVGVRRADVRRSSG